jgi:hypothetical protein
VLVEIFNNELNRCCFIGAQICVFLLHPFNMPAAPKKVQDEPEEISSSEESVQETSKKGKRAKSSEVGPPAKRGPGRPRKDPSEKKKYVPSGKPRGRPKGSGTKKSPAKKTGGSGKGRGRPKKTAELAESD